MADHDTESTSADEWQARVSLAALYRLAALYGWDDIIFTHISARLPGPGDSFLINPLGSMFEEITASSLVKVNLDGSIVDNRSDRRISRAGFVIHSAIHAARRDAQFVIHLHTIDGMAVASQEKGLLPLNQISLAVLPQLAYHDYEGIALDTDECERLVADLGDRSTMLLRHHGTLSVGSTAAAAWISMYALERACSIQVRAMTGGSGIHLAPRPAQEKVAIQVAGSKAESAEVNLAWNAMLRRLHRLSPGFDS